MSDLRRRLQGTLTMICRTIRELYTNGLSNVVYQQRASELDTRLSLVRASLQDLPADWDGPWEGQESGNLFTNLVEICIGEHVKDETEAWSHLPRILSGNDVEIRLQKAWEPLLSQEAAVPTVKKLIEGSEQLANMNFPRALDNLSAVISSQMSNERLPHDCAVHFKAGLFELIQEHVTCNPPCSSLAVAQSLYDIPHLSRLCLDSEEGDQRERNEDVTFIDLLISSNDLKRSYWQDVRIKVNKQRTLQRIDGLQAVRPGYLCTSLGQRSYECLLVSFDDSPPSDTSPSPGPQLYRLEEEDTTSPLKPGPGFPMTQLLLEYKFCRKDKILLAHTIALAYCQLFGSQPTRNVWTSESIYFMEQNTYGLPQDHTEPLTSCLVFDFDTPRGSQPAERQIDHATVHKFPGILSIGIIILEIALKRPFPLLRLTGPSLVNRRRQMARQWVKVLRATVSASSESEGILVTIAHECVEFKVPQGKGEADDVELEKIARKTFYRKVVRPLQRLVKVGYNNPSGGRICPAKQDAYQPVQLEEQEEVFHTGQPPVRSKWLDNLKEISKRVEEKRRKNDILDPIKVAILDTGCEPSLLPGGEGRHKVEWKDFIENKDHPEDTCGHGTLMVRLVLECAPNAEILVARIAENRRDVRGNQAIIAEAIHWAGIEHSAHIISMSFGFDEFSDVIDQAIEKVTRINRPVILLSSAGNSERKIESFPARHRSVIAIYAANCRGVLSESNARFETGSKNVLSTFGDDIPQDICQVFKARAQFKDICRPGSSISTAVAAGISATMLAYNQFLQYRYPDSMVEVGPQMRLMWRTEGMEAVLKGEMSRQQPNTNHKFLDPTWFWGQHNGDFDRLSAIVTSMNKAMAGRRLLHTGHCGIEKK